MDEELRDKLFPDGMPTVEEFIRVIAEYVKNNCPDE